MDEIAAQTLSSRKTVRRYLMHYQIPLRPEDKFISDPTRFGIRRVNGELVDSQLEIQTIEKMRYLRSQGHSYREIVSIFNDLKNPCRKEGARWHIKTVFTILNRTGAGRK